jgi:phage terminase large subunit-like protein
LSLPHARPTDPDDLLLYDELAVKRSRQSLSGYLDSVVIDSRPERKRFRDVREPWQTHITDAVTPAIEYAAGTRQSYTGPRCFFITLPTGHDKTSLVARCVTWAITFGKNADKAVKAVAAAADTGQARILLDAAKRESKANPWLDTRLPGTPARSCR